MKTKQDADKELDNVDFYDLMQNYRIANMADQQRVVKCFEDVKAWIRLNYENIVTSKILKRLPKKVRFVKQDGWPYLPKTAKYISFDKDGHIIMMHAGHTIKEARQRTLDKLNERRPT